MDITVNRDAIYEAAEKLSSWNRWGPDNQIEHTRDKMAGRVVLLDVARFKGVDALTDGYDITMGEVFFLKELAESQQAHST